MYAMDYMIEGIHTLAAFSEMLDIFDYIGTILHANSDSESFTKAEVENEDTLNDVASKLTANDESVGEKTQSHDVYKNGLSQETLGEYSVSSPISENTLKRLDKDTNPLLNNPIFEKIQIPTGNIVSLIESEPKIVDIYDGSHQIAKSEKKFDRTFLETESDHTALESKCDKEIDDSNKVVSEGNNRQEEENFNQYEVFTETCKYVPNVQSSNNSLLVSNLNRNELNQNTEERGGIGNIYGIKNGHQEELNCSTNSVIKNEAHIELNTNGIVQKIDANDLLELKKKFITSSWDLVSIVKLLYVIPEPRPPKVPSTKQLPQTKVLLLSKGSFSKFPERVYEIVMDDNSLTVLQGSESVLSFSLSYAEFSLDNGDILRIDNKMGRTLYMKCSSKTEGLEWTEALQSLSHRQTECINLVHYPLKCYQNIIVIDLGSCSTRAGILMDQPTLPTLFFPSVCATDKTTGSNEYGVEALQPSKRQNSTISFPIRPSVQIIKHNIDVEKVTGIFKKIFSQLRVSPENYTVQVCLPRSLSINAQNALVKVLLEELNVKAVSLAHQAILTMYAHNVSTGVVVDIGDRMDIMPVIDGFIVETGVTRLPYGGQRLIHHMKHALAQKHISLSNEIDSFVVQYITENLSYIALDYEAEQDLAASHPQMVRKSINLQSFAKDESCLQCATLEEARFKVPEGLFNPDLWGLDFPGIHKLVQKAIQAAGVDTRKKVAENIYVSGGVTLIPGFVDRLRKEVTKLNEPRITPKVFASEYRYHCTFIGACRFARMEVFPQVCVSKEEYLKNQHTSLKKFALCI